MDCRQCYCLYNIPSGSADLIIFDDKMVVNQHKLTNKALSVAESKVRLFKRMITMELATKDVNSFVQKQARMTRTKNDNNDETG